MGPLRRSKKCPGDMKVLRKKKPEQFEVGGKERVSGGYEGARKKDPINVKAPGTKKSARGRWLVSCSGTLLLLDDEVVDKLFGF